MGRLDVELVSRGLYKTREKAKDAIIKGLVKVNSIEILKPSFYIESYENIEIIKEPVSFVSRGGLKLEKAIDYFNIDVSGKKVLDIGASTGGFTHCVIQRGATKVYAVDVGHGQLADELKNDFRVVNLEGTDIRSLSCNMTDGLFDFASIDVSFISLEKVLPGVAGLLNNDATLVCLIKPQFEAGKAYLNKRGIVTDDKIRKICVDRVISVANMNGFTSLGYIESPIKGKEGNVEFLLCLKKY